MVDLVLRPERKRKMSGVGGGEEMAGSGCEEEEEVMEGMEGKVQEDREMKGIPSSYTACK